MDKDRDRKKPKYIWKTVTIIIILIIAVAGIVGTVLFYDKYQQIKKDPTTITKQETVSLVKEINKLMVLPTGEDPTVATVTDKTKLTDQTFFKDTQNGDKLLAYTVAKKAILYRPSTQKIINIAPFNISSDINTTSE